MATIREELSSGLLAAREHTLDLVGLAPELGLAAEELSVSLQQARARVDLGAVAPDLRQVWMGYGVVRDVLRRIQETVDLLDANMEELGAAPSFGAHDPVAGCGRVGG